MADYFHQLWNAMTAFYVDAFPLALIPIAVIAFVVAVVSYLSDKGNTITFTVYALLGAAISEAINLPNGFKFEIMAQLFFVAILIGRRLAKFQQVSTVKKQEKAVQETRAAVAEEILHPQSKAPE